MYSPTMSLADPPAERLIAEGMMWVQSVALGSTATTLAVLAIAAIGLQMLSGRLELRRGIMVVLGCFILFGAGSIAAAITGLTATDAQQSKLLAADSGQLTNQSQSPIPLPVAYDPYAGASVPAAR